MKYYIKAKRGSTESQIDLSTVTEVRILDKENADIYVGTTKYTVSGTEMVTHLISCCRILERGQSMETLKTDLTDKLEVIGTKLDTLVTTISEEADKTRVSNTDNTESLTDAIAECSEQIESIPAGIQNPFESISIEGTADPDTNHNVPIANIVDVWVGPHSGFILTVSGERIGTTKEDAIKIKEQLTQFGK